ncbi:MAG: IS701 family transposase, partial [Moorea sp. SIO2I5]|nr:IS701 family transposase [Moorena sp. SIO2I5]
MNSTNDKSKTVWVATVKAQISGLEGERTMAIVMNASSWEEATDIDYLITNVDS